MTKSTRTRTRTRIAADIGGTFTDVTAFDEKRGLLMLGKTLTTPQHLIDGILEGMHKAGVTLDAARLFLHGSTIAINTMLDLGDLDDLVIDYLRRKFAGNTVVVGYVASHDVRGGMQSLLRALATDNTLSPAAARDLMVAIEASVVSVEEQQRA